MNTGDKDKLRILLSYWIEHNKEHSGEFREWAEKAVDFGGEAVHGDMLSAAQYMDKATESLLKALEKS